MDLPNAKLKNKIAGLEQNLEIALQQRDRLNEQHSKLLKQQIYAQSEVEFLDELEPPQKQKRDATDEKWGEPKVPTLPFGTDDNNTPPELEKTNVPAVEVKSLDVRIKEFIKKLDPETTTWEDMVQYIQGDEVDFLRQLQMQRTRKHDRIVAWIPVALANHIGKHGRKDLTWVGKTWMQQAEDILKQRTKDALNAQELTVESAHRAGMEQPDWEQEVVGTIDKFFIRHDEAIALNEVSVKYIVQAVFANHPSEVDAIATRMFELIPEYDDSEDVYAA